MKPAILNRTLECDDGIFNVNWWLDRPKLGKIDCEWKVMGGGGVDCGKVGEYWCTSCGLVMCLKHRKKHEDSAQHKTRLVKFREKGT
jgi:hypothetical protein